MLTTLNWQFVEQRTKYHKCLLLVYKIQNNMSPNLLETIICHPFSSIYNTRYAVNSRLSIYRIPEPNSKDVIFFLYGQLPLQ